MLSICYYCRKTHFHCSFCINKWGNFKYSLEILKATYLKVLINLIIFACCFGISYKPLQDIYSEGKKSLKPLRSVLNTNVFIYDGFNTELRINDFQQLHSRPINRSEYYRIHTEEEQLDNLHHQYLSRKSWKYRTWLLLYYEYIRLQKLKIILQESICMSTSIHILTCCSFEIQNP